MLDTVSTTSQTLLTPAGIRIQYDTCGSGPPLVLVHGAFSDHRSNWVHVKPTLAQHFTVYAMARRGRGLSDATRGHELSDEISDLAALIELVDQPVALLGHSYGAHVALGTAARMPQTIRQLVLYEPPVLGMLTPDRVAELAELGAGGEWDALAWTFFSQVLEVPLADLAEYRESDDWPEVIADAPASLEDLAALTRHHFDPQVCRGVVMPVLLQTGSQSPPHLYMTNALQELLPQAQVGVLDGQAHEGMTTAPDQYEGAVIEYLLGTAPRRPTLARMEKCK